MVIVPEGSSQSSEAPVPEGSGQSSVAGRGLGRVPAREPARETTALRGEASVAVQCGRQRARQSASQGASQGAYSPQEGGQSVDSLQEGAYSHQEGGQPYGCSLFSWAFNMEVCILLALSLARLLLVFRPATFHNMNHWAAFQVSGVTMSCLCILPPIFKGRSVAHNIATFLSGEEKWRWNPATIVAGAFTMLLLIVTEIVIKTKLRITTTATTTNNTAIRKDTNPLKNVTLIQCIEIAFFILLQLLSQSVSAPLPKLIFPHLLLGLPNSLKIYLFFLWNAGARAFAGKKVAAVRAAWEETRQRMRRNRQNQIQPIV